MRNTRRDLYERQGVVRERWEVRVKGNGGRGYCCEAQ